MSEGQCCDHGNFPRTHLSGSRLSWPKFSKARSGLVPTLHRCEKKLAVFLGYTAVQGCGMLHRSPSSHGREMFCCNPGVPVGSSSRQHTDLGVETSGWPLV